MPRFLPSDLIANPIDPLSGPNFNPAFQEERPRQYYTKKAKVAMLPSVMGDVVVPDTAFRDIVDEENYSTTPNGLASRSELETAEFVLGGGSGSGIIGDDPTADAMKRVILAQSPYAKLLPQGVLWNMTDDELNFKAAQDELAKMQAANPEQMVTFDGVQIPMKEVPKLPTREEYQKTLHDIGLDTNAAAWVQSLKANNMLSGNPAIGAIIDLFYGFEDKMNHVGMEIAGTGDTIDVVTPSGTVALAEDLYEYLGKVDKGWDGAAWFRGLSITPEVRVALAEKGITEQSLIGTRGVNEAKFRIAEQVFKSTMGENIERYKKQADMDHWYSTVLTITKNLPTMIAGDPDGALGALAWGGLTAVSFGGGAVVRVAAVTAATTRSVSLARRATSLAVNVQRASRAIQRAGQTATAVASVDLAHFAASSSRVSRALLAIGGTGVQNMVADYKDQAHAIAWTMAGLTTESQHEYDIARGSLAFLTGAAFGGALYGIGAGFGALVASPRADRLMVVDPPEHMETALAIQGEVLDGLPRNERWTVDGPAGLLEAPAPRPRPLLEADQRLLGTDRTDPGSPPLLPPPDPLIGATPEAAAVISARRADIERRLASGEEVVLRDRASIDEVKLDPAYRWTLEPDGSVRVAGVTTATAPLPEARPLDAVEQVAIDANHTSERASVAHHGDTATHGFAPDSSTFARATGETDLAYGQRLVDADQVSSVHDWMRLVRTTDQISASVVKNTDTIKGLTELRQIIKDAIALAAIMSDLDPGKKKWFQAQIKALKKAEKDVGTQLNKAHARKAEVEAQPAGTTPKKGNGKIKSRFSVKEAENARRAYQDIEFCKQQSTQHRLILEFFETRLRARGMQPDAIKRALSMVSACLVNLKLQPLSRNQIEDITLTHPNSLGHAILSDSTLGFNLKRILEEAAVNTPKNSKTMEQSMENTIAEVVLHEIGHIYTAALTPAEQLRIYELYSEGPDLRSIFQLGKDSWSDFYGAANAQEMFANMFMIEVKSQTGQALAESNASFLLTIGRTILNYMMDALDRATDKDLQVLEFFGELITRIDNRNHVMKGGTWHLRNLHRDITALLVNFKRLSAFAPPVPPKASFKRRSTRSSLKPFASVFPSSRRSQALLFDIQAIVANGKLSGPELAREVVRLMLQDKTKWSEHELYDLLNAMTGITYDNTVVSPVNDLVQNLKDFVDPNNPDALPPENLMAAIIMMPQYSEVLINAWVHAQQTKGDLLKTFDEFARARDLYRVKSLVRGLSFAFTQLPTKTDTNNLRTELQRLVAQAKTFEELAASLPRELIVDLTKFLSGQTAESGYVSRDLMNMTRNLLDSEDDLIDLVRVLYSIDLKPTTTLAALFADPTVSPDYRWFIMKEGTATVSLRHNITSLAQLKSELLISSSSLRFRIDRVAAYWDIHTSTVEIQEVLKNLVGKLTDDSLKYPTMDGLAFHIVHKMNLAKMNQRLDRQAIAHSFNRTAEMAVQATQQGKFTKPLKGEFSVIRDALLALRDEADMTKVLDGMRNLLELTEEEFRIILASPATQQEMLEYLARSLVDNKGTLELNFNGVAASFLPAPPKRSLTVVKPVTKAKGVTPDAPPVKEAAPAKPIEDLMGAFIEQITEGAFYAKLIRIISTKEVNGGDIVNNLIIKLYEIRNDPAKLAQFLADNAHLKTMDHIQANLVVRAKNEAKYKPGKGEVKKVAELDENGNKKRDAQGKIIYKKERRHETTTGEGQDFADPDAKIDEIEVSDMDLMMTAIEMGLIEVSPNVKEDLLLLFHGTRNGAPPTFGRTTKAASDVRVATITRAWREAWKKFNKDLPPASREEMMARLGAAVKKKMGAKVPTSVVPRTSPPKRPTIKAAVTTAAALAKKEAKLAAATRKKPAEIPVAIPKSQGEGPAVGHTSEPITKGKELPAGAVVVVGEGKVDAVTDPKVVTRVDLDESKPFLDLEGGQDIIAAVENTHAAMFENLGIDKDILLECLRESANPHSTLADILKELKISSYSMKNGDSRTVVVVTADAGKAVSSVDLDPALSAEARAPDAPSVPKETPVTVPDTVEVLPRDAGGRATIVVTEGPSDAPKLTPSERFIAEELNNKAGLRENGCDPSFSKTLLRMFFKAMDIAETVNSGLDDHFPQFTHLLTQAKKIYQVLAESNRLSYGTKHEEITARFWLAFDRLTVKEMASRGTKGKLGSKKIGEIIDLAKKEVDDYIDLYNKTHGTKLPPYLAPPNPHNFKFSGPKGASVPTTIQVKRYTATHNSLKEALRRHMEAVRRQKEAEGTAPPPSTGGQPKEPPVPPKAEHKETEIPKVDTKELPDAGKAEVPPDVLKKVLKFFRDLAHDNTELAREMSWIGRFFGGSERITANLFRRIINDITTLTDLSTHEGAVKRSQVNILRFCSAMVETGSLFSHQLVAGGKAAFRSFEACAARAAHEMSSMIQVEHVFKTALETTYGRDRQRISQVKRQIELVLIRASVMNNGVLDPNAIRAVLGNITPEQAANIITAATNLRNNSIAKYKFILELEAETGWHHLRDAAGQAATASRYFAYTLNGHLLNPARRLAWVAAATRARIATLDAAPTLDSFVMWSMGWVTSQDARFNATQKEGLTQDMVDAAGWDAQTLRNLEVRGPNSRFPAGTRIQDIPLMQSQSATHFTRIDPVTGEVVVCRVPTHKTDLSPADLARYNETVHGSRAHFGEEFNLQTNAGGGVVDVMMNEMLAFKLHEGRYAFEDDGNHSAHFMLYRGQAREGLVIEPLSWTEVFSEQDLVTPMRTSHLSTHANMFKKRAFELLVQREIDRATGTQGVRPMVFFSIAEEVCLGLAQGNPDLQRNIRLGFSRIAYDFATYAGTTPRTNEGSVAVMAHMGRSLARMAGATLYGFRSLAEPVNLFVDTIFNLPELGVMQSLQNIGMIFSVIFDRRLSTELNRDIGSTIFTIKEMLYGYQERYIDDDMLDVSESLPTWWSRITRVNTEMPWAARVMQRGANVAGEAGGSRQTSTIARILSFQLNCSWMSRAVLSGRASQLLRAYTPEVRARLDALRKAGETDVRASIEYSRQVKDLARNNGFPDWGEAAVFLRFGLLDARKLEVLDFIFRSVANGENRVLSMRELQRFMDEYDTNPAVGRYPKDEMKEVFSLFTHTLETLATTQDQVSESRGLNRASNASAGQRLMRVLTGWSGSYNSNVLRNLHNRRARVGLSRVIKFAILSYVAELLIEWIKGRDIEDIKKELMDPSTAIPRMVSMVPIGGAVGSAALTTGMAALSQATEGTFEGYGNITSPPVIRAIETQATETAGAISAIFDPELQGVEKAAKIIKGVPVVGDLINNSPFTIPMRVLKEQEAFKQYPTLERLMTAMEKKNPNKYDKEKRKKGGLLLRSLERPSALEAQRKAAKDALKYQQDTAEAAKRFHESRKVRAKRSVLYTHKGVSYDLANLLLEMDKKR